MVMHQQYWDCSKGGENKYVGPDHCTFEGANKLASRIKAFWQERGERVGLEVFHVQGFQLAQETDGSRIIWGVRRRKQIPVMGANIEIVPWRERPTAIGETPRQRIKRIIKRTAGLHCMSYGDLMDRTPDEGGTVEAINARLAAVRAVHDEFPRISGAALAKIFGYSDHTTVARILQTEPGRPLRPVNTNKSLRTLRSEYRRLIAQGARIKAGNLRKFIGELARAA